VTRFSGVSSATDLANAYHNINTTAFALEAISSLWNLGMCTAFVGTFSLARANASPPLSAMTVTRMQVKLWQAGV
jgi:hypothetical protein